MFDIFDFKGAGPDALRQKYKEIALRTGGLNLFTRKELAFLPQMLSPYEQVYAFSSGLMNKRSWLIVLTDKRVIFLNKNMFVGSEHSSVPLNRINEIGGSTGWFFGNINIEDGAKTRLITTVPKVTVIPFTNMVRDAMERSGR